MKVAGWCEAHYIDMMPHNPLGPISTAANLHFAAAVPNYAWLEERTSDLVFSDEMFPVQPRIEGVRYPVPAGPGLGVEFNEDAVGEPFRFWEAPTPAPPGRLLHQPVTSERIPKSVNGRSALQVARMAAREAGDLLLRRFGNVRDIRFKGAGQPCHGCRPSRRAPYRRALAQRVP